MSGEGGARRVDAVGLPLFDVAALASVPEPHVFDLSSHRRAREALDFGLRLREPGFNIFVLGEDRSGRMTAALEFLEGHARQLPPPADWVYLANFRQLHRPSPYRLPAGAGGRLRDRMAALVPALRVALAQALQSPDLVDRARRESERVHRDLEERFAALQSFAEPHGIALRRGASGIETEPREGYRPEEIAAREERERAALAAGFELVRERLREFTQGARAAERDLAALVEALKRDAADEAFAPLLDPVVAEFGDYAGLGRWFVEFHADLLDHLALLAPGAEPDAAELPPEERYAVNLLVDHGDDPADRVILEPNPTYENLFGRIEYRSVGGVLETNFTLIRAGALHRANGGILVLRAEAIAQRAELWAYLKAALRDNCIRIEEPHRQGAAPLATAPSPRSIPLRVKLVIVGAPRWYYTFFSADPDFRTHFKVKADIDPDMPADAANLAVYAGLVRAMALRRRPDGCEPDAVARLLAEASRWADDRRKLSARFEQIEDIVAEAAVFAQDEGAKILRAAHVRRALDERTRRNARVEDRSHEAIRDGMLLIDTDGARIGQINALTVRDQGDYEFGLPSRVTARVFVGRHGIADIERAVDLGGPVQQKGVLIIGGYLNGRFARRYPLSFSATLTFEQSYGGVEGDSASMAELLALISALAEAPLRQDIAITGSVNQNGEAQAVGGISRKIEGFHRTCLGRGLTGRQGVIVPRANEPNLVLSEEVAADVAAGRFHVWSVRGVDDALGLLASLDPGAEDAEGRLPPGSVAARVQARLDEFDRLLSARALPSV